jgi:hypothetical protein
MITISLIDSTAEDHHLTAEVDTRITPETVIQTIVEVDIRMIDEVDFEVDFKVDQTVDSKIKIVLRKDVLYVGNLVVGQPIIQKTSATTRKSASQIDILNSETLIAFVSTFWSMKVKKMRKMTFMTKWFSILRK